MCRTRTEKSFVVVNGTQTETYDAIDIYLRDFRGPFGRAQTVMRQTVTHHPAPFAGWQSRFVHSPLFRTHVCRRPPPRSFQKTPPGVRCRKNTVRFRRKHTSFPARGVFRKVVPNRANRRIREGRQQDGQERGGGCGGEMIEKNECKSKCLHGKRKSNGKCVFVFTRKCRQTVWAKSSYLRTGGS